MKIKRHLAIAIVAAVIGFGVAGCESPVDLSKPSTGTPETSTPETPRNPADVTVTGISLNKSSTSLAIGGTETLFAAITPSNATNRELIWFSNNTSVAIVSDGLVTGVSDGMALIIVATKDGGYQATCTVKVGNSGDLVDAFVINRYQANTYTGTDKIKYSYSYGGLDYYYIYLGQMGNIPLFYDDVYRHSWAYSSSTYTFSTTNATTTTVSNTVSKASEDTLSVSKEHTVSTGYEYSLQGEINAGFQIFGIGAEAKRTSEKKWNDYTSNTTQTGFQQSTSLTNTVEYATSKTEEFRREKSYLLTKDDREGYYRYTRFSVSDVYLWVVKNSKTNEIDYEFREYVIPGLMFWDLDYCETPDFKKTDATKFKLDISILNNLPPPDLDLSNAVPYGWYTSNPNATNFTISTAEQLREFANIVNGTAPGISWFAFYGRTVTLTNDIDLNNKVWTPIGIGNSSIDSFLGTFEGGGKTISGLYINSPAADGQGLFGYFYFGVVQNLAVSGTVVGKNYVGGVAGANMGGTVQNCSFSGYVTGNYAGGVVGENYYGVVKNCRNTGTVNSNGYAGGIAGINNKGTIENSYSTGNVTGSTFTGGVVGSNDGTVRNCFSTGTVTGTNQVGGIAGVNGFGGITPNSTIENCYSTGNVTSTGLSIGGIVGGNYSGSTVRNCYSTGSISSTSDIVQLGGITGLNSGVVENSYSTVSITGRCTTGYVGTTEMGIGGVVGRNESGGTIRNCLALNPSITRSGGTASYFGRVVGNNIGTLVSNYGLTEMVFTGITVTVTSSANGIHGTSINKAQSNTVGWWTQSGRWNTTAPATAWDFTNIWQWDVSSNLPVLR